MQIAIPPDDLRMMQLLQLDMLVEMDRVCRDNNIRYVITGGTLLGAVRHKGYIPWDDDADICMLREEYDKFVAVADQMDSSICFFQDHSTDPNYRWGYGKIRRTGTTYVRAGQEHLKGRTGIFVDVFPMDDIPTGTIGTYFQMFLCFVARKITYSELGKVQQRGFWRIWYSFLSVIPVDFAFKIFGFYYHRSRNDSPNRTRCISWGGIKKCVDKYSAGKYVYGRPKQWLLDVKDYDFEGFKLLGPVESDLVLSRVYGQNYMIPLPPDQRGQNSPCSSYSFGQAKPVYFKEKTS